MRRLTPLLLLAALGCESGTLLSVDSGAALDTADTGSLPQDSATPDSGVQDSATPDATSIVIWILGAGTYDAQDSSWAGTTTVRDEVSSASEGSGLHVGDILCERDFTAVDGEAEASTACEGCTLTVAVSHLALQAARGTFRKSKRLSKITKGRQKQSF